MGADKHLTPPTQKLAHCPHISDRRAPIRRWDADRHLAGLAVRYEVTALNTPIVIDSDYCALNKVFPINHGHDSVSVEPGDRIAQALVSQPEVLDFVRSQALPNTERGDGGYGHTGTSLFIYVGRTKCPE